MNVRILYVYKAHSQHKRKVKVRQVKAVPIQDKILNTYR